MRSDTFDRLQAVVCHVTGKTPEEVTRDATFEDLECDSLETVQVAIEADEEFDIDIPDDKIPRLNHTVGDLVQVIDDIRSN